MLFSLIIVGLIILLLAQVNKKTIENSSYDILLAIGSGIFTSGLVSIFCEKTNRKLENERKKRMKRNILQDFTEYIKVYFEEDFDFIRLERIVKSDFIYSIDKKIERYINIGITFYDEEEFEFLETLQGVSSSLKKQMQKDKIRKLYEQYTVVFNEALSWNFDFGPYQNEQAVYDSCNRNGLPISRDNTLKILEFLYVYEMYVVYIKKFHNVFEIS